MPSKYCTKCGAKTEHAVKTPKFCVACGLEFSRAFVVTPTDQPIISSAQPIQKAAPHKTRRPQHLDSQLDPEDSRPSSNEMDEAREAGRQLAASIQGDITFHTDKQFGVKLGELFNNPDRFQGIGQRSASMPIESSE